MGEGGEALAAVGVQVIKVLMGHKVFSGSREHMQWGADEWLTVGSLGKKALTCNTRQVPWCKCSHRGEFQATYMMCP